MPDTLLREINLRLAEGLECKDLLHEKNNRLRSQDTLIQVLQAGLADMQKALSASEENWQMAKQREAAAYAAMEQAKKDAARLRKGRNTWRWVAVAEAAILGGITYLIVR